MKISEKNIKRDLYDVINYFNSMKPKLPELCNVYSIRKPTFHLPVIRHEFARQLIGYKLFRTLKYRAWHFVGFIQSSYALFHWI